MKFIDSLAFKVEAGRGGNGCVSFRRERFVPRGGPDGGNGGAGGNVIIRANPGAQTLLDLNRLGVYKADNGAQGKGKDMTGRTGSDLIITVPYGTMIYNDETGELLTDISKEETEVVIAHGGAGGRGNTSFASATHRAPRSHTPGELGETVSIRLELKLLADVGIVGYPNAGKSTFISVVSAARPKVADYPFTTLAPVLGVVRNEFGGSSYVLADMPGLIEGAHEGVGLGLLFLRHIERTGILLHFVDASEEESMVTRYESIRKELEYYSDEVGQKQEIVVATKLDSKIESNLEEFKKFIEADNKEFYAISSLSREGVKDLLKCIDKKLKENREKEMTQVSET